MGQDLILFAVITTDAETRSELRPVVSALEAVQDNVVVNTRTISGGEARGWLLPTHVTVALAPIPATFQLLQDLEARTERTVTAALVDLYADLKSRQDRTSPKQPRPLTIAFHAQTHERFRFVLGMALRDEDVVQALVALPATLQRATARLSATKKLFGDPTREAVQSRHGPPYFELVHLYEDPLRGWEIIA